MPKFVWHSALTNGSDFRLDDALSFSCFIWILNSCGTVRSEAIHLWFLRWMRRKHRSIFSRHRNDWNSCLRSYNEKERRKRAPSPCVSSLNSCSIGYCISLSVFIEAFMCEKHYFHRKDNNLIGTHMQANIHTRTPTKREAWAKRRTNDCNSEMIKHAKCIQHIYSIVFNVFLVVSFCRFDVFCSLSRVYLYICGLCVMWTNVDGVVCSYDSESCSFNLSLTTWNFALLFVLMFTLSWTHIVRDTNIFPVCVIEHRKRAAVEQHACRA